MSFNESKLTWIIETSLAPSPIASVQIFSSSLTTLTKNAFCKGVDRQHKTDVQFFASLKNGLVKLDLQTDYYQIIQTM